MSRVPTPSVRLSTLLACALLLLPATTARADFIGSAVSIYFLNADGLGHYELSIPIPSDPWGWELDAPLEVYNSSSDLLATIDSLAVHLDGDPAVNLSFAVTAGSSDTVVSVVSSTVTFAPLIGADAFATATLSITDGNGNGASASGYFPGNKAYQARYNGGTVFADLVSPLSAGSYSSAIATERNPLADTVVIPGSTSSIQSEFLFLLSARDSASGTSRFQVNIPSNNVPEPATYVLAGIGSLGLWMIGRRRNGRRTCTKAS